MILINIHKYANKVGSMMSNDKVKICHILVFFFNINIKIMDFKLLNNFQYNL